MSISEKIAAYLCGVTDEHDREWSWVYCYRYFHAHSLVEISADRDRAALHLGFYLASWGMYRPTSFLFKHSYTVHLRVIDALTHPEFGNLWNHEFGTEDRDQTLVPSILKVCDRIRNAYRPFGEATDTLVTKVLLGTTACMPAVDKYFNDGYKHCGFRVPRYLNSAFVLDLLRWHRSNIDELQTEQRRIAKSHAITYPVTKLVDMYFHQIGLELNPAKING